ALLSPP
ncbi:entry exclusion lipoprotein TrbK, partial [Vibrio parahaemolyticus V-223/04]